MSSVEIGPIAHRPQSEDGHALQRRLLQDLERQWLDQWRAADQLRQIGSPRSPHEAVPEPQPVAGLDAASSAIDSSNDVRAPARSWSVHGGVDTSTLRPSVGMPLGEDARSVALHGDARRRAVPPACARTEDSQLVREGALAPSFVVEATCTPMPLQPAAWASSPMPMLADGETMPRSAEPGRQLIPHPRSVNADGLQRLTLRELSPHEVLASFRDAQFTAGESQRAAQGLAHALLEAGYARVRVVVNGQQALAPVPFPAIADSASPEPRDSVVRDDPSEELHHGN